MTNQILNMSGLKNIKHESFNEFRQTVRVKVRERLIDEQGREAV